jgi:hypothetical protein
MRLSLPFFLLVLFCIPAIAQKKQLDHSVYDGWQSIGERKISANGEWVAYTIDVQEGDGVLVVQRTDSSFKQTFPRGYGLAFSEDNQFLVFKIKPTYLDTRNAKIKKKKPDEFPKDSLGLYDLLNNKIEWKGPNEAYLMIMALISISNELKEYDTSSTARMTINLPSTTLESINFFLSRITGKGEESAHRLFAVSMLLRPAMEEIKRLDTLIETLKSEDL